MSSLILLFLILVLVNGGHSIYDWQVKLVKSSNGKFEFASDIAGVPIFVNTSTSLDWMTVAPFGLYEHLGKINHNSSIYGVSLTLGQENNDVLRRLVLSGAIPILSCTYVEKRFHFTFASKNELKVRGSLTQDDTGRLFYFYPLPYTAVIDSITVEVPSISFGLISVKQAKKTFHIYDNGILQNEINEAPQIIENWNKVASINGFSSINLIHNKIVYSYNNFNEIYITKNVIQQQQDVLDCANGFVQVYNGFLLFRKSGVYFRTTTEVLRAEKNSITILEEKICPLKYSHFPNSFSGRISIITTLEDVYWVSENSVTPGIIKMSKLRDGRKLHFDEFTKKHVSQYKIIDHAMATQKCCEIYFLIQDLSDQSYHIARFTGLSEAGTWSYLTKFLNRLPEDYSDEMSQFIDTNMNHNGLEFTLSGASFTLWPDNNMYLYGSVLLSYNIKSGILEQVKEFNRKEYGDIYHLVSFKKSRSFAVYTSENKIWHSHALVHNSDEKTSALFVDEDDNLYKIVLRDVKPFLSRIKIMLDHAHQCSAISNCVRVIYSCENQFSAHSLQNLKFTRIHTHFLRHPSALEKTNDSVIPTSSRESAIIYSSMAQLYFMDNELGVKSDWYSDNLFLSEADRLIVNTQHQETNFVSLFRASNNLLPQDIKHYVTSHHYTKYSVAPAIHEWQVTCKLPKEIYLDYKQEYRFNMSYSTTGIDHDDLRIETEVSDHEYISINMQRHVTPISVIYQIAITGLQTAHHPPGAMMASVGVTIQPTINEQPICCDEDGSEHIQETNLDIKVGCPPGYKLEFDPVHSLEILATRGRSDSFKCPGASDGIPCFTTSEFVAAFKVVDTVMGVSVPFDGQFTIEVVGGGIGNINNIRHFTKEELPMYNFMPNASGPGQSLIWSLLDMTVEKYVEDGKLLFDTKHPHGIVFKCERNSPCGNIPFGERKPSEYYLTLEVANSKQDLKTNCAFKSRFHIRLIGIQLNPVTHMLIMLVTFVFLVIAVIVYYFFIYDEGKSLKTMSETYWSNLSNVNLNPQEIKAKLATAVKAGPRGTKVALEKSESVIPDIEVTDEKQ